MMPIEEAWPLLLAGLAGAALGAFFFGGLWWTVQQTVRSERSLLWHFGGLLLRMAVTLLGFYLVGAGQWTRLVACLVGFVIARAIVVHLSQGKRCAAAAIAPEAGHAPQP